MKVTEPGPSLQRLRSSESQDFAAGLILRKCSPERGSHFSKVTQRIHGTARTRNKLVIIITNDWSEQVARIKVGVRLGVVQTVTPRLNLKEGHREWGSGGCAETAPS